MLFLNSLLIVILTMFLISNLNNLIYYFYLTVSHIKKIYQKIIPKLKYIKFGKNLSVVSEFKNVIVKFFQVDSLNKVLFIILLLLIFIINISNFKKLTLLLIIIASVLITYLILEFLKHQSYVSQLIIGQFYVPFISIIIVFQIFIFEIEKYKFTLSIFYFTLNVFILSLYISTYTFYKSENGKIKLLNCILCYFNIILVCVMLFTYMGYGFMIYEINNQTSNLHNLQFNIKGKQNVINTFACFVSYGIDNVNKDIGVTLTPGKSKDIKTNEILFRLTCKIYVSTYIALVLSFLSNNLFKRNN